MRDPLRYRYCMLMGTGQASPRIVSQLYRALLKLQLLICISIKASWDDNKENSVPTEISNTAKACKEDHATCLSWTWVCFCHWNCTYMAFQLARASVGHLVIPQWGAGLGAPPTSGSFAQKGATWGYASQAVTDSFTQASRKSLGSPDPPWEAGVFHLWFPNCPGPGKSWAFCNSFVWLLLGAIYPFNSVCSNVFHITSDIFSFHISYTILIIFSWAIPFWKQITFS